MNPTTNVPDNDLQSDLTAEELPETLDEPLAEGETAPEDIIVRKPRHGDKTAAREDKNKRLEAALRNNLRRRKSQSRARKD